LMEGHLRRKRLCERFLSDQRHHRSCLI